jgi:hypothetical protein
MQYIKNGILPEDYLAKFDIISEGDIDGFILMIQGFNKKPVELDEYIEGILLRYEEIITNYSFEEFLNVKLRY